MPRPCLCNNFDKDKQYDVTKHCRLCWLYYNDSRYKDLWDMPTQAEQTKNMFVAIKNRVQSDFQDVDNESYEARLKICETCDKKTSDWRCTACGCFLSLKAKWASETCPEGKWALPVLEEKKGGCNCGK